MAEPPVKDDLETPNIIQKLKAETKLHVYKDLLLKWWISDKKPEKSIINYLISMIYNGLAKTVSLRHTKADPLLDMLIHKDLKRGQVQALVDMLLPIASGVIDSDPSISTSLTDGYEAHTIPWGYYSDPWDHGTLLMRNRWYNLYEKIPDLEYMLILVQADTFREMLWDLEPKLWNVMVAALHQYRTSIKVFAEVTHLDFRGPFTARTGLHSLELAYGYFKGKRLTDYYPHNLVVNDITGGLYKSPKEVNRFTFCKILYSSVRQHVRPIEEESEDTGDISPNSDSEEPILMAVGICTSCSKLDHFCLCCRCCSRSSGKTKMPVNPSFLQLMDCSDTRGIGVRSLIEISEGVTIGALEGRVVPPRRAVRQVDSYPLISGGDRGIATTTATVNSNNWCLFVNHSCQPNAKFMPGDYLGVPAVLIIATKCIEPMQEITVHYGDSFLDSADWDCCCNSSNCIEKVLESDGDLSAVDEGSPIEYRYEKNEAPCS